MTWEGYNSLTRLGTKSLTYTQRMTNAETGNLLATQDAVEVIFDPELRKAAEMPGELREIPEGAPVSEIRVT